MITFQIILRDPTSAPSGGGIDANILKTLLGIAGSVGTGLLGVGFYCLKKRMKMADELREASFELTDPKTTQTKIKQGTLQAFARKIFNHFKTTGLFCSRGKAETTVYLRVILNLLTKLEEQGDIDLRELNQKDQKRVLNITLKAIHKEMIGNRECSSHPSFFSCNQRSFTAEQLNRKVDIIARAIAVELEQKPLGHPVELVEDRNQLTQPLGTCTK